MIVQFFFALRRKRTRDRDEYLAVIASNQSITSISLLKNKPHLITLNIKFEAIKNSKNKFVIHRKLIQTQELSERGSRIRSITEPIDYFEIYFIFFIFYFYVYSIVS